MRKTSRRHFARTITAVGATLPLVTSDLLAQTPPSSPPKTAAPSATPDSSDAEKPSPLAIALTGVVQAEYGRFLSGEEMERIGNDFQDAMPAIQRLRDFKLVNSDEPDMTFAALTKRW